MSKRKKVMIATPIHRQAHPRMKASRTAVIGTSQRTRAVTVELHQESLISRARQTLLASFLQSDNEYIYFWDDDIEAVNIGGAAGNLLDMLVVHDRPLVGGLYPTKGIDGHCAARRFAHIDPEGRLWQIQYLAGGSMLIRRDLVEQIIEACPCLGYTPRANEGAAGNVFALFMPMIHERELLSEDYAFCQRADDAGAVIYADLDVKLYHWGEAPFCTQDPRGAQSTPGKLDILN